MPVYRKTYPFPFFCFLLTVLLFCTSCSPKAVPLQWPEVRFCTSEKEAVNGSLFYGEMTEEDVPDESVGIRGQMILEKLKGWYTAVPIPSFSYLASPPRDGEERKIAFYAYWTGDDSSLCYLHTRVFISGFKGEEPDPAKFRLYYNNPSLDENILLAFGPDRDNRSFFKAVYDQQPLEISNVAIAEEKGLHIRHVLLIYAGFPEEEANDESGAQSDREECK